MTHSETAQETRTRAKGRAAKTLKGTRHDARLDFRLSRDAKERIEKAALVSGQSLSDFAASTLVRQADDVLARHNVTVLSDRDRDILLALLDNPPEPSPGLRQVMDDYKRVAHSEGERTVLDFSLRPASGDEAAGHEAA